MKNSTKFYHRSDEINTNGHWAVGVVWNALSSKGDKTYNIEVYSF